MQKSFPLAMQKSFLLGLMILALCSMKAEARPRWTKIPTPRVTYDQAKEICHSQGKRLSTVRELSQIRHFLAYSNTLAPPTISETPKSGFKLINGLDSAGNPDPFYIKDSINPVRIRRTLGNMSYWALSESPRIELLAYRLDAETGDINEVSRWHSPKIFSAICVELD